MMFSTLTYEMSAYLKALGLHVYLATTKKSYVSNDKYLGANAQALKALKQHLAKNIYPLFLIVISLLQCETH